MSTPFKFKELILRNFMSFGNVATSIDLSDTNSTLIQGENIDAVSNNGAGKTTLINAICYALYNKPFDNISLQKLINSTNNSKNTLMEVRLIFEKGDDEFEIYRCRGETFNIHVYMNGEDVTLDSVAENDRLVCEIAGMSYELFTKVVIFSGSSTPFLQMPVSQQRLQIEELFNITMLTEKAVKLKEVIKNTESKISIQEAVIKEQESQVALYNRQCKDAESRVTRWEEDRTNQVKSLTAELALIKTVNMDEEIELHQLVAELIKQERELNNQIRIHKTEKTTLESDVKKLQTELKHLVDDKCPYCLQAYEGAGDKLVEKQKSLETKQAALVALLKVIVAKEDEVAEITNQKTEAESIMKFESLEAAIKAENSAAGAQSKIDDWIKSVNPHIEAYEDLKKNSIKTISYEEIDNAKRELEHQQFLLKLLTDKNSFIRRKIISKTIPFLNKQLMYYTKETGLPHVVKFDDDMSCTVSEYGRELDFGNLSGGEKKRVNLSLSLAFRDVLHHLHAKVNCLFIDEIDGSLDGSGVDSIFKLLKTKTRDEGLGLWIISHRPEAVGRFDRSVIIRKENGFSRILDESGSELGVT